MCAYKIVARHWSTLETRHRPITGSRLTSWHLAKSSGALAD